MNIAFSLTNLELGGAQTFVVRLANDMALQLNQVVYIYDHNPEYRNKNLLTNIDKKVKIKSYCESHLLRFFIWKINALCLKINKNYQFKEHLNEIRFKKFVKKNKIDIVNSHMAISDFIVSDCKNKYKYIPTLHGEYELNLSNHPNQEYIQKKIQESVSNADSIIYTAEKNYHAISAMIKNSSLLIKKIYVGFSDKTFKKKKISKAELNIPDNAFVVGMISRGIPEKGWDTAIEIIKKINKNSTEKIYLFCIGEGDYLKKLIETENNQYIILKQFASDFQDYFSYYEIFDVLIFPSRFKGESVPNAVIEAIYCNKPVIASDIAEIKNMISVDEKNWAGDVIRSIDGNINKEELYETLLNYVVDKKLLEEKKLQCKKAFDKFNMNKIIDAYVEVFNNVYKTS